MVNAKDVMTRNVITVNDQTPILEAIDILVENRISGMPVVSDNMDLLGIITENDILQLVFSGEPVDGVVSDYMTEEVFTVDENVDLHYVCECLIGKNIKRVPVISKGKLAGVISRRDIIKHILEI